MWFVCSPLDKFQCSKMETSQCSVCSHFQCICPCLGACTRCIHKHKIFFPFLKKNCNLAKIHSVELTMHYGPRNAHFIMLYAIMLAEYGLQAVECTPLKAFPYTYGHLSYLGRHWPSNGNTMRYIQEKITPIAEYQRECEPISLMLITVVHDAA